MCGKATIHNTCVWSDILMLSFIVLSAGPLKSHGEAEMWGPQCAIEYALL